MVLPWLEKITGSASRYKRCLARAMRLNLFDPLMKGMRTGVAYAHLFLGRCDEAASWAAMALQDDLYFLLDCA